jgi:hypothetical protein
MYNGVMDKSRHMQDVSEEIVHPVFAYAGVWFAVIAWGASFVAARVLLHAETTRQVALSPTVLAALRFSGASLFFIVPLGSAIIRGRLSLNF